MYRQEMRHAYSVRVYLHPPEELRRRWKVRRDSTQRGYSEQEVLHELDIREPDSAAFIRPQRHHADIEVSFFPAISSRSRRNDDAHLNVRLTLHGTLHHPDLPLVSSDFRGDSRSSIVDGLLTALLCEARMIHVVGWYDNEWGYASRVADLASFISEREHSKPCPEHIQVEQV